MKKYFLLVFTVALFGCPHHVASANDNNSKDSTVNDAADTSSLKPQAAGFAFRDFELVDTNNTDIDLLKIVNTIVVKAYWQDIQPQENGPLVHPNAIDNALNYVRTMNAKNPGMNLCLKVRLYCGIAAPQWLKNKAGTFTLQSMAGSADCVKFWDPACITAYADIQKKMAETYDNIPEIRDIVNSGTGSSTAEGMIRNAGKSGAHKQNAMSYLQAGYTTAKDIDAIKKSIDAMEVWKHTRISMAFSSFALISNNNIGDDVSSKLFNYLEKGISNGCLTVPALSLPPQEGAHRILHIHKNVPGVLSEINTLLSKNKINIVGQYLKTNEEIGYVVLDVDKGLSKNAVDLLKNVKETIKVRRLY